MKRFFFSLIVGCVSLLAWAESPRFLTPDQAFRPEIRQLDDTTLEVHFSIAAGYYLYRDRLMFSSDPRLGAIEAQLPIGKQRSDPSFGTVETYPDDIRIPLKLQQAWPQNARITLQYQGCAEGGICFPPQSNTLSIGESQLSSANPKLNLLFNTTPAAPISNPSTQDTQPTSQRPALFGDHWLTTLGLFFMAGIGLAFTACMYPLIPIVSGIVLGGQRPTRRRAIGLSMTYVQGMALTYTGAGLLAAASGAFLAAALQQPWVIAGFSLFFVAMAFSMFGFYQLQLPATWQSVFNALAHRLPGGSYVPVFVMGALSALIVGPCMAPPLAAALVYLGKTGDMWLGGAALYALAIGMGLPLLAIGVFGAGALPKLSFHTLRNIKYAMGLVLLAVAVWMARPLWHTQSSVAGLDFYPIDSVASLENALQDARGMPVMLDFYADWCVSCLEFEQKTLSDTTVQNKLQAYRLLRADVTANTEAQQALMRHLNVYGPPTLLFFDPQGKLQELRVIGFEDAASFSKTLERLP